jgi:RNA polymerase sigma factor (sigma-70 family)
VPLDRFADALETSAAKAFAGRAPADREVERYLRGLHVEDLALACACAEGHERAWDHFVRELRPVLYRAADALDPSGRAREAADALYADLYGVKVHGTARASLFRYFHGRSSLATWLRAVLAQRHVDVVRADRHTDPLPGHDGETAPTTPPTLTVAPDPDPDCRRFLAVVLAALRLAVGALGSPDRLRFACYYADGLTLAETGKILGEHEATVSRQLARTRLRLRQDVERRLREVERLNDAQIARAFECAAEDAGAFDLSRWAGRKDREENRSI